MADADLNQSCTYADLIIQAIRRWPERTAMIDRREQVSYRELGERISRTMQCFAEHGLAKGDGIAQLSLNRVDAFVTVAACYLSGIRYTPMHPLGSLDDHLYTIQDVQISHLVVDPDGFAERGAEIVAAAAELQGAFALGPADFAVDLLAARARHPAQPLATAVGPDDILFIAHTGGTTGRPKGVVHLQRTMVANALICTADWEWMPDPRLLVVAPISHAAGFMLVPCMLLGGTVILEPGFDAGAFIAAVEKHRATMTFLVPTMVYMVLDHPDLPGRDLSSLRTLMFGAAPMSPSRLKEGLAL
ncbi:MAG: AMP-binding protein, partial [Alphaproteobacteria bacterium]|nr:AMP-binding protein [Alphaproteobacteria bacterium]